MGLFDSLQNGIAGAQSAAANASGALPKKTVVFQEMPETLEQMKALPEASMKDPLDVAALTVAALCVYLSRTVSEIRTISRDLISMVRHRKITICRSVRIL